MSCSKSQREHDMPDDVGGGEWVFLNIPGHSFHLQMFKCFYEGHATYTLLYGQRAVVCTRESFIKKEDMDSNRMANLQMAEALRRDNEHSTKDIRQDSLTAS